MGEPQENIYFSEIDKQIHEGALVIVGDPRRVGEGRDTHIEYLIQIAGHSVRRRFSEFDSFRDALVKLYPTCIVPPLPEKEGVTLTSMGLGGILTQGPTPEAENVERRRVYLQSFLNRIAKHPILSTSRLFLRFLEVENWPLVLVEETKGFETHNSFYHFSFMTSTKAQRPDARFLDISNHTNKFSQQLAAIERNCRRYIRRQNDLAGDYAELGAIFQSFASNEKELSQALGKTGEAIDTVFLSTRFMVNEFESIALDPMQEYLAYVNSIRTVLKSQEGRHAQVESAMDQLQSKREYLKQLEADLAGIPAEHEPSFFRSTFTAVSKMFDANPMQTTRDNIAKTKATIEELEKSTDAAHSEFLKSTEAVLHDYERFNQTKANDFKHILTELAKSQVAFYQKNITSWEAVVPVVEKL